MMSKICNYFFIS